VEKATILSNEVFVKMTKNGRYGVDDDEILLGRRGDSVLDVQLYERVDRGGVFTRTLRRAGKLRINRNVVVDVVECVSIAHNKSSVELSHAEITRLLEEAIKYGDGADT